MSLFEDLENFLGKAMGNRTAHHVLIRFCSHNNILPEKLSAGDLPKLGSYLRENLSFFVGHTRAEQVHDAFLKLGHKAVTTTSPEGSPSSCKV